MKIQEALLILIDEAAEAKPGSFLKFAAAYAEKARTMRPGSEEWRTQMLYIKSNLVYWRGDTAKIVKAAINAEISK